MSRKILIVEDELLVAKNIQQKLENKGFDIVSSESYGEDALSVYYDTEPDLILMDIRLKGELSGFDVAQEVRKKSRIPIVFMTAFSDDLTMTNVENNQPSDYLTKPFEFMDLYSKIIKILKLPEDIPATSQR